MFLAYTYTYTKYFPTIDAVCYNVGSYNSSLSPITLPVVLLVFPLGMEEDSGETIEFTQIPAETSALTQFTSKAAAD